MFIFPKHAWLTFYRSALIICLLWLGLSLKAYAGLSWRGLVPIEPSTPHLALIIENNQYEMGNLSHSANDAKVLATALEEKGFEVILKTNLNRREMKDAIREFRSLLSKKGGIGLFYFSGYGTQIDGKNYLLPINNTQIKDEVDIEYEAIPLDKVLKKMQKTESDLNIIILDVSPDTPYLESRYKSKTGGLAKIAVPPGTIIGYATASSSTTFRPELYTKHLIKEIQVGGRIDDVFMRVRNAVKKASRNQQIPWHQASLTQVLCFGECQKNILFAKQSKRFTRGSFIAFATEPGEIAYEALNGERNGFYTKHLLRLIRKPGLSLEQIFKEVRTSVAKDSHGRQSPWYHSSVTDKPYFAKKRNIQKIALVVGNAHYEHNPLKAPVNDARDMAQALKELGFNVMLYLDVTQVAMLHAINDFRRQLGKEATIGLFYFSGQGAQVDGKNYLLPIDNTNIIDQWTLRSFAIQVNLVLEQMQDTNDGLNILILDACRDNPFSARTK